MKRILILAALTASFAAGAQVPVRDITLNREGETMQVGMTVDLAKIVPDNNAAVVLTPVLYNGADSVHLRPLGVYSRGRFLHYARAQRSSEPFKEGDMRYYVRTMPDAMSYTDEVPYQEWMDGASLRIDEAGEGCCGKATYLEEGAPLAQWVNPIPPKPEPIRYIPNYGYVHPDASTITKEQSISGEAYVVFAAGKSVVDTTYRDNRKELRKIRNTIDSVRVDPDRTITRVLLKGYSSPDGRYSSNDKLARERTESILGYVKSLYPLDDELFVPESVAENWDGLRAAVDSSDLPNRDKILELIDSDIDPDLKESRLKARYPKDYKKLSTQVFPLLRRTDYNVSFTVRSYTTAEDVRRMMRERPRNLSISEFFLAAQGLEPGTSEFNDVFALAARVYPDDHVANINAANAAMSVGNLTVAARYLEKAGDSAKARYAKGVYAALSEDFAKAKDYFASAELSGVKEASAARALVESIIAQREEYPDL